MKFVAIISVMLGCLMQPVFAEEEEVYAENLLFMKVPVVYSATKTKQSINDSPSAMYVINAEDIKCSGATTIQEVLRMVPGVNVVANAYGDTMLTIRGFYERTTAKTLVLINGRSTYMEYQGETEPSNIDNLVLEDIDRIEIIRGPGSALYGANAFDGVISIYTKPIKDSAGIHTSVTGGEYNYFRSNLIYARTAGDFGFKFVGQDFRSRDWLNRKEWYADRQNGYLEAEYQMNRDSKLWLSAGELGADDTTHGSPLSPAGALYMDQRRYAQVKATSGKLDVSMYYDECASIDIASGLYINPDSTLNVDVQHSISFFNRNTLIYGGNYKHIEARKASQLAYKDRSIDLYGAYLQDQYKYSDALEFTLTGRYDYHPIVGEHLSPRIAVVCKLKDNHILRASHGFAFRNPNILNLYRDYMFRGTTHLAGNLNLKSEEITSTELGYRGRISNSVNITADVYYNQLRKLISQIGQVFNNNWDADAYGGEIGADLAVTEWLVASVNHSYEYAKNITGDVQRKDFPVNMDNAALKCNISKKLYAGLEGHYVEATDAIALFTGATTRNAYPAYTLVNANVIYKPLKHVELSAYIYNLLQDTNILVSDPNAARRFYGKVSLAF